MFILNGKPLSPDSPFRTPDGTQYPARWLRLSTPQQREAIGITEEPDAPSYNQEYYWGYDESGNLIPKDLEELKKLHIQRVKQTANGNLQPTDWMIVRESDNDTPVPTNTKTTRQNIRLLCHQKVSNIGITTTTPELATYITSPDYSSWSAPYPSWTLNTLTVEWNPPVPYPTDGEQYTWNEEDLQWSLVDTL